MPNEEAQNGDRTAPQVRETFGERLASGVILDVVRPKAGLQLVVYEKMGSASIASYFEENGVRHTPPHLDPSITDAIYFPWGVAEYGTDAQLLRNLAEVYREHCRLAEDQAALVAAFNLLDWIADQLPERPTFCVIAASMRQAQAFFQVSSVINRRALVVAQLSPQLPFNLQPTLLVNDRKLTLRNAAAVWQAANYAGTFVAGPKGTLRRIACPRIVLLLAHDPLDDWCEDALHIMLPQVEVPRPNEELLSELRAKFQPQLQMFRLRWLSARSRENKGTRVPPELTGSPLAQAIFGCIPDDPEIVGLLTPLLERYQQETLEQQLRDPRVAIVQAIWDPAHRPGKMSVSDIAGRMNAQLRKNGEFREYSAREVGWMLRDLALYPHKNHRGRALEFCADVRRRAHELAGQYGLEVGVGVGRQLPPLDGCPDCSKVIDGKANM